MNKYIVITTINKPTEAIYKFSKLKDWMLIIVGDKKTPHEYYKNNDNWIYFSPEQQEEYYPKLSNLIGWNKSNRRNLGFVYAYSRGADVLALIDDDNIPLPHWGQELFIGKKIICRKYITGEIVADPLGITNYPHLWHRGFPLELISSRKYNTNYLTEIECKIQVDLWNGDPDVDAIERMIFNPIVDFNIQEPYTFDTITPYDSQNTFISREMIQYFCLLPGVNRVDDIWGSYLSQMTYKKETNNTEPYIVYNKPSVYQLRNTHNLIKDFNDEIYGTLNVMDFLKNGHDVLPQIDKEVYNEYRNLFKS